MPIYLWIILLFIILQRIVELVLARRNEKWMLQRGGVEWGREHYKWFIVVHSLFFLSIVIEISLRNSSTFMLDNYVFAIFLLTQVMRVWCIQSLGRYWNTRIIILPNS